MPEQSLTSAKRNEPIAAPGDGASRRSSRARLDQTAALLAPIALIGALALAGGGFSDRMAASAGLNAPDGLRPTEAAVLDLLREAGKTAA